MWIKKRKIGMEYAKEAFNKILLMVFIFSFIAILFVYAVEKIIRRVKKWKR